MRRRASERSARWSASPSVTPWARRWSSSRPGRSPRSTDMVGGGPFRLEPGQWTDDTSMAMCLAESILDTGRSTQPTSYGATSPGTATATWSSTGTLLRHRRPPRREPLRRFEETGGRHRQPAEREPRRQRVADAARGRAHPLARSTSPRRPSDRASRAARRTRRRGRSTPAGARGDDGRADRRARRQPSVFAADFWRCGPLHPEVEAVTRGSWQSKQPPEIRGTGYCVDALEAALWAVGGAGDFRDAVLRAANLGDDADTTAAIAGQLAGAAGAASGSRSAWRDRSPPASASPRSPRRLFDAATGRADEHALAPRSIRPRVLGTSRARSSPASTPATSTPSAPVRSSTCSIDHGIRTFVDLTTPDDGLDPYAELVDDAAAASPASTCNVSHFRSPTWT